MIGEVYLDTENVFRGFRPRTQSDDADTVQAELFGSAVGDSEESSIARMRRVVTALYSWFEQVLHEAPRTVSSYGKVRDPGVETFLTVLAESDESFARVPGKAEANSRRTQYGEQVRGTDSDQGSTVELVVKPSAEMTRALYTWAGVRTLHVSVGIGRDKAEQHLVRDFHAACSREGAPTRHILGSGDHGAIYPFDHACIDPAVKAWVLLPPRHLGQYRKFGEAGHYPHIPAGRVTSLPEVLHLMRVRRNKRTTEERRAAVTGRRVRVAKARSLPGLSAASDSVATMRHVALVANIDVSQLRGAIPGSQQWLRALGERSVIDAVTSYLPEVVTEAEALVLAKGQVHPMRVAAIVRMCILLSAMRNPHLLDVDALKALLSQIDQLHTAHAELITLAILQDSYEG